MIVLLSFLGDSVRLWHNCYLIESQNKLALVVQSYENCDCWHLNGCKEKFIALLADIDIAEDSYAPKIVRLSVSWQIEKEKKIKILFHSSAFVQTVV